MISNLMSCLTLSILASFASISFYPVSNTHCSLKSPNNNYTISSQQSTIGNDLTILSDSLPSKSRSRSRSTFRTTNDEGEKIYLSVIDGEIKKLKINGKVIPPNEYHKHNQLVEELLQSDTPPTPTPPKATSSAHDKAMEAHEKAMEAHEKAMEAHEKNIENRNKQVEKLEKEARKRDQSTKAFAEELEKDGLISNKEKFNFYLSLDVFRVNGTVQSITLRKKYIQLYKKLTGNEISAHWTYEVTCN